ncbi:AsmA-like C-terminal region-containing protein [Aureisphaera sp. CAU 1614]|uniref:AsmA-like C-terminal region-containing protein n=1 Tax=Halomarinibacterium sedimenti TaxID=2857106 RepID=A0A9X1FR57_9FLAO|nr:AsmA-like C-terminal region-containing protein [Halomarinibacterium sedimenti]MBW2939056.1 AsmA-like C-terminal region-containing protein [Halomarinibacterium sedimenti]
MTKKKILKIVGIFLLLMLLLLALTPIFFKGTMERLVKRSIDANLNADVAWEDFDLTLFRSFPDAALTIKNFRVINRSPFEGDTLASGAFLKLDLGITQLFKSENESIVIDALYFEKTFVNILIDSTGQTNYDIAIKSDSPIADDTKTNTGFTFDLKKYELKNSRINYLDKATQTFLMLKNVNHTGKGDFSLAQSELETKTSALASLRIEDIEYLSENSVSLDAIFQMDFEEQKYAFLENEAKINELPLTFDGFVKINENNNEIDITFKTPSSDFKNFLAVIPKVYVKEIDGVSTTGSFTVDGMLKGIVDDDHIPTMDIKIASENASFKYPDLPKAVQNISIDATLKNETGLVKDTYLNIGGMTFKIDNEVFSASGNLQNLTANVLVNLALKGTLNLANIEKVLPIELEQDLTGIFKADFTTNFDMESVEKEQYQNIKSSGTASLKDFAYQDAAFKNAIQIADANVTFFPGNIKLNSLTASSGQTDLKASGTIQNLIPWILAKQDLKGNFTAQSNTFNLDDFMTAEENTLANGKQAEDDDVIKIPDFLNATLNFTANKVIYDNVNLTNVKGAISIKDEAASLSNVSSSAFGGDILFSGNVSTKDKIPSFTMDLDLKKIDIGESFGQLDLLKYFAPIAKALDGDINTTIKLNGSLNKDMTPNLATLAGNALAQIITAEVNPQEAPLLTKLGEKVSFLNIDKLSLRDLSTAFSFNDGKIEVQPFDFNVKGVKITAAGSHGLDKTIDYNLTMDVPAHYLGGEVNKLLAKLDPEEAKNMTVVIPAGLKGNFTSPQVSLKTEDAVKMLTQKLIDKQKQDLKDKGIDILKDITNVVKDKPKDSTGTQESTKPQTTTDVVKDIFGNIFGKKKKQDSIKDGN